MTRDKPDSSSARVQAPSGRVAFFPVSALENADDAALAAAVAARSPQAASVLWRRFLPLVQSLLRRSLGPAARPSTVEDLTQEAFLRIYNRIGVLRDPSALRSFVIGVTMNVVRKTRRYDWLRRHLRAEVTDDREVDERVAPSADADTREAARHLYRLFDRMGAEARSLVVLRMGEGLDLAEVAEALGISLATAKRHLAKANARLLKAAERDPVLAPYLNAQASSLTARGKDNHATTER